MKKSTLLVMVGAVVGSLATTQAFAAPSRIVEGWYAHNATLIMLGAQNKIVGTVAKPSMLPWMFKLFPELHKTVQFPSPRLNGEAVLALKPDVTFIPKGSQSAAPLRRLGLTVKEEGFDSFNGMRKSLNDTARVIDTPLALQRNQDYQHALAQTLTHTGNESQGPSVVHVESVSPLRVDGSHTIINEWIKAAGGHNGAIGVSGNKQPVSIEQLLEWQPDIIIVGGTAGSIQKLQNQPLWKALKAVKEGRVYRNPVGIFPWDRYGPELLLQLKWASDIIDDGKVDSEQMKHDIMAFYQRFYGISLNASEAGRILTAQPPQA